MSQKKFTVDYKPELNGLNKVLGNLERDIMEAAWSRGGEFTVRDIYSTLLKKRNIAYTTVMTVMGRLTDKGLLLRRKEGVAHYFKPTYSLKEFTNNIVAKVVDSLMEDFGDVTLAQFVNNLKEDESKVNELERLLNDKFGKRK